MRELGGGACQREPTTRGVLLSNPLIGRATGDTTTAAKALATGSARIQELTALLAELMPAPPRRRAEVPMAMLRTRTLSPAGRRPLAAVAALAAAGVGLVARPARAVDPFEIQVYDGTANAPWEAGLELHLNYVLSGLTTAPAPEAPPNHQEHLTLEPSLGLTRFWELGGYLQAAVRPEGTFDFAGVKLRNKFVTPPGWRPHVRLGLNVEFSYLPATYEASRWGFELRPIVAWEDDDWLFAVNPIVDGGLAGDALRAGPTFEPAAMAKRKILDKVAVGVEYFAAFGPIASPLAARDQQHYLFEAVDLLSVPHFELNVGVGEGLTAGSNPVVVKMILGWTFGAPGGDRGAARPPP